jgi:hypothetical protein
MAWINRITLALGVESKMRKKKSTTITSETERQIFISHRQSVFALCEACGYEVRLVSVDEAAAMARINSLPFTDWSKRESFIIPRRLRTHYSSVPLRSET